LTTAALAWGSADAMTVNVSSLGSTGTQVTLAAGTYEVAVIGTAQGGSYNAWNPWGNNAVSGCATDGTGCSNGWTSRYAITIGGDTVQYFKDLGSNNPYYATALQALASYQTAPLYHVDSAPGAVPTLAPMPVSFSLAATTAVTFSVLDSQYGDNFGGVSLNVSAVPEPAALALFAAGALFVASAAGRQRG
jgi:hypothetical protein